MVADYELPLADQRAVLNLVDARLDTRRRAGTQSELTPRSDESVRQLERRPQPAPRDRVA